MPEPRIQSTRIYTDEDLEPGMEIIYSEVTAYLITPHVIRRMVRVVWIFRDTVYYRNNGSGPVLHTGIARFLEIVNKAPPRGLLWSGVEIYA